MPIHECAKVPEQIELKYTSNGYIGIFAKRDFIKGEELYSHSLKPMPENSEIILSTPLGEVQIDMRLHGVKQSNGWRDYYGFDSFMNHSCDANSFSICPESENLSFYTNKAAKNIQAGDEITANYLLFDWDCDGHSFDCLCGSPHCYGHIRGFQALDFETQCRLLPEVDEVTLRRFFALNIEKLKENRRRIPVGALGRLEPLFAE